MARQPANGIHSVVTFLAPSCSLMTDDKFISNNGALPVIDVLLVGDFECRQVESGGVTSLAVAPPSGALIQLEVTLIGDLPAQSELSEVDVAEADPVPVTGLVGADQLHRVDRHTEALSKALSCEGELSQFLESWEVLVDSQTVLVECLLQFEALLVPAPGVAFREQFVEDGGVVFAVFVPLMLPQEVLGKAT